MGRLANRGVIHVEIIANGAHHHLTSVQPDAYLERDPVAPLDFGGILLDGVLHAERRIAGPHRMVLQCYGGTKEGHDAVTHDLIHGAFVAVHSRHQALQHRIKELAGLLRIAVSE